MRSVREIFKSKEYLLDEPEVEKLVEYCEELQDEIVDLKFQKTNNKELAMLDMLKEVIKGCNAIEKEQMEHGDLVMKHQTMKPRFRTLKVISTADAETRKFGSSWHYNKTKILLKYCRFFIILEVKLQ